MNLSSPKPTLLTLAALGSLILTFLVFGASIGNDFVTLDDALLILQNTDLRAINFETLSSIFTRFDPELYIPLTFFSYQIDYLLGGGYEPSMFHLTNVFLHAINVFFLFWLLKLLTGKTWLAGVLAALFCVHPLNVETIAWASARKDVLMTTYALGSLVTWLSYRASGKRWLYILSVILFGCSLLSKVSAVLLPLVLIGFDWATCQGSKQLNPCPTFNCQVPVFPSGRVLIHDEMLH